MNRKRNLLIGAILLFSALAAGAQDELTLKGQVTEQGRPLAGAVVTVDGEPLSTDGNGGYGLAAADGSYTVEIDVHGYTPVTKTVVVAGGASTGGDIALEPLLSVVSLSGPAALTQGAAAEFTLRVKNDGPNAYSLDAVSLRFHQGETDVTGQYVVTPDTANPAAVAAKGEASLRFTVTPSATAPTGAAVASASLFAFDTGVGSGANLVKNGSFEQASGVGAVGWGFGQDGLAGSSGSVAKGAGFTGANSVAVTTTGIPADFRGYVDQAFNLEPGVTYVLSGYVKTSITEELPQANSGADVYAPIVRNVPYIQPEAPYVKGTSDWRKTMVTIAVSEDADNPEIHVRGQVYAAKGTAWFDNLSLSDAEVDGSLSVTGGAAPYTLGGAAMAAPKILAPASASTEPANPPVLSWEAIPGALTYDVQASTDPSFAALILDTSVTTPSLTPANPLPVGTVYWRVRARASGVESPWSDGSYMQGFTPRLRVASVSGPAIAPNGSGVVTVTLANDDAMNYNIDAAGLRLASGGADVTAAYTVTPDAANPNVAPSKGQAVLRFDVAASSDAPSGPVTATATVFGYNTAVGTGSNLLSNPSLETGEIDDPLLLPEGWVFASDAPSEATTEWVTDVAHTGQRSIRVEKTAPANQSYLQQGVSDEWLAKVKPGTTYLFSGWVRTQELVEGGSAGLLLWFNDGAFHPSERKEIRGDNDWTKLSAFFTTSDLATTAVLARGNFFGEPGGFAWFDDFAISEGVIDGAVWLASDPATLGAAPSPKKGDLNGDNRVNVQDATLSLRIAVGLLVPTDAQKAAGDVNGDTKLNVQDTTLILRAATGGIEL